MSQFFQLLSQLFRKFIRFGSVSRPLGQPKKSVVKVWQDLIFKVALELYMHAIKIHHINGGRRYLIISKMSMKKKIITKQYALDN